MTTKFSVGQMVYEKSRILQAVGYPDLLKVIGYDDDGVIVKIDSMYVEILPEDLLISEEDGNLIIKQYQEHKALLEQEFSLQKQEIVDKLAAATKLVEQAVEIAQSCKRDFTVLTEEIRPLFNALNRGGWKASQIKC